MPPQRAASCPCSLSRTGPEGAGASAEGSLLFASSIRLQTPNWAATSNTRINQRIPAAWKAESEGRVGIACPGSLETLAGGD